jgi:F-type H+-transporting ATPase subunit a
VSSEEGRREAAVAVGPADAEAVGAEPPKAKPRRGRNFWLALIGGIVLLDVLAFIVVPPYPAGQPGVPISGIGDLISANLELPAPHVVYDFDPSHAPEPSAIAFFHPSITSTILTTWLVMLVVLAIAWMATRGMKLIPTGLQNGFEAAYEALEGFAVSLGGPGARAHVTIFAGFFLFILFSNWSGLIPIFGKFHELRAPTSDVNVTIGLALVAFFYFQVQGIRSLGVRRYLGKFFVFSGFKRGIGQGLIDLYVGLIEFFLEFIKPVTLAMRLFGNIFGGELALGVITALTIAVIPLGMISLELLLNFVQALIFSVLTLMYTLIAIEGHAEEEHAAPEYATEPEGNIGPPLAAMPRAGH